jgi:hypothetical protein
MKMGHSGSHWISKPRENRDIQDSFPSATNLPPGLTINASSGLISGLLSNTSANGSPYTVTVTATDGSYSGSASFSWSVTNQSVTVTNPGPQTSTAGNVATLQIQASDPDGYTLSYSATGLPPGLSIDPSTGYISGQIDPTAFGPYAVETESRSGLVDLRACCAKKMLPLNWAVPAVPSDTALPS